MRKFILVSVSVLIFLTTVEIMSQCPPGWTGAGLTNIHVALANNQICYLRVDYCHRDNAGVLEILITKIEFMDVNCPQGANLNTFSVWNQLTIGMLNRIANPNVHGKQEFPPCSSSIRKVARLMKANCWKYSSLVSPIENSVVAQPCVNDDDYCISNYEVCLDYRYSPPLLTIDYLGMTEPVEINCDYHEIVVPIGVDFNSNPWESPCTATCNE